MNSLSYLRGRRLWMIPNLQIYGTADEARFMYLGIECAASTNRVMFGTTGIGGSVQNINYSNLIDFRGNNLPATINAPKVIIRHHSPYTAFLVGDESNTGFQIARDSDAPGPITVDLFIYEMGV